MTSPPLITVGITCYQARETIARAVKSALEQDWPNVELLIVDDCSTDGSVEIVKELISNIDCARLIQHDINSGPATSRNTLLANATGEFLVFFDDDDVSLPSRVRSQFNTLVWYESCVSVSLLACYASGVRRYENGYELKISAIGSRPDIPAGEAVIDYLLFNDRKEHVFYGGGVPTCALMARTSTFKAVGGFDSDLRRVEDIDFAIRLAMLGGHFIGCADSLYIQYATQALDKSPLNNFKSELKLIEKNINYLKCRNRYEYAKKWFEIRYYHFSRNRFKFFLALISFLLIYPIAGMKHFMRSAPRRLIHEFKMFSE